MKVSLHPRRLRTRVVVRRRALWEAEGEERARERMRRDKRGEEDEEARGKRGEKETEHGRWG